MPIILKQETEGSVPNPASGKGVIYINTSGELAVKKPDGTGGEVSYAAVANSVAVANVVGIGNIATVNLNGNSSQVLYGNGVWAATGGGTTATALNATLANVSITGGTNGQVLSTDGSGTLSWVTGGGGGGGTPGGSNTEIQFNDEGSFGGNASFTYDKANAMLSVTTATIGNIYYEDNIVSPIPTYVETEYGNLLVNTPFSVNSPLEVLSGDTSSTAFFTLSGSDLTGSQSGGTNNSGAYYTGSSGYLRFYNINQTTLETLITLRIGDIVTATGTNGFFTGSSTFRVLNVSWTVDYAYGSHFEILMENVSGDVTSFNANILQAYHPLEISTVAGGLDVDYINTPEVVSDEIVVNDTLNVAGNSLLGAVTQTGPNEVTSTVNYFGNTSTGLIAYYNDFFSYHYTSSSGYPYVGIYLNVYIPTIQNGIREITTQLFFDTTTSVSWTSVCNITQYSMIGNTYQGSINVPIYWENSTPPTSFTGGKYILVTYKLSISGGSYQAVFASYKTYG